MVNNKTDSSKRYYSTAEAASLLGISRIMVFKRIKSGILRAERFGRNWLIPATLVGVTPPKHLTIDQRKVIEMGVAGTVKQYSETLKLLGNV